MNAQPPADGRAERPPAGGRSAGQAAGAVLRRLGRAWRALHGDQRLATIAALALFVALLLPWYSYAPAPRQAASSHSALSTFGWVEGAVLLVAAGVLFLLFKRAERRAFHLPGGDGGVIAAAGVWAAFLIVWRFFDRPDLGANKTVDLRWGIFVALAFAVALAYAGTRIRAAQRPEPPLEATPPQDVAPAPAPGTVRTPPLADEAPTAPASPGPPEDATAATRVHRGDPSPDDRTTALPRPGGDPS